MSDDLTTIGMLLLIAAGVIAVAVLDWRYVRRNGWRRRLVPAMLLLAVPWGFFAYALLIASATPPYLVGFLAYVVALIAYLPASLIAVAVALTTQQRPLLWFAGSALGILIALVVVTVVALPGQ